MKLFKQTILGLLILLSSVQLNAQYFQNPILAGFYPDPSICKVGKDYYLVNSSFAYYPGLSLFHSTDLVNWKQIGSVLNDPAQLNLDSAGVSRGLFAPTIRYHKGLYYVICTLVDKGGNFIVKASNPLGPWSKPYWLPQVNGIDPSIFFDEDDKAYIFYNSIPPNNISLYGGHRTIRSIAFDYNKMEVIGENKIVINGGTDISKKPVWIEGPHIIKKDGWYYLICAEGGTSYNHSEVVFRSKTLDSGFISYEKNPILTQRHLDKNRPNPIINTGHADFVQDPNGNWYAVFLGCRPYEAEYFNIGRETFMAPVKWANGWPTINPAYDEVQYKYPIPYKQDKKAEKFNGNYYFKDEFNEPSLNFRYNFLRTKRKNWYKIAAGKLAVQLQPENCSGLDNPSFIGFRQSHLMGYAATQLEFTTNKENEKAGLLVFQNEKHYYFLCKSFFNNKPVVQLYKNDTLLTSIEVATKKPIQLKIESKGKFYSFYFATGNNDWQLVKDNVDATFLSTELAGGFVGCFYALYATSNGMATINNAYYNWFENKNEDKVYNK